MATAGSTQAFCVNACTANTCTRWAGVSINAYSDIGTPRDLLEQSPASYLDKQSLRYFVKQTAHSSAGTDAP
jgi:hypothetical protein